MGLFENQQQYLEDKRADALAEMKSSLDVRELFITKNGLQRWMKFHPKTSLSAGFLSGLLIESGVNSPEEDHAEKSKENEESWLSTGASFVLSMGVRTLTSRLLGLSAREKNSPLSQRLEDEH